MQQQKALKGKNKQQDEVVLKNMVNMSNNNMSQLSKLQLL